MGSRQVGWPLAAAVAALAVGLLGADAPAAGLGPVSGFGSATAWGVAETSPTGVGIVPAGVARVGVPPVRGQAGPIVGGLSASSVGVLVVEGGMHQCTAAVVASRSRRLLATAAHCVWLAGAWRVSGAFFIPGFAADEEPHGRWPVDVAYVAPAWQQLDSPIEDVAAALDVAFVSLTPVDGKLPEQVLGAQGITFSAPEQLPVAALGYPAVGAYDGQSLRGCVGHARAAEFTATSPGSGGAVWVLPCDMTEGASGGPWLAGPDPASGRGQVVGVVSGGDDTELVSPKFGPQARQLYDTADAASARAGAA